MSSKLSIKQQSMLTYFVDAAEAAPTKINQLCRLTLSSKMNYSEEFSHIVESFMDSTPDEVKQKCQELLKKLA